MKLTRALLTGGVAAGPIYVAVGAAEMVLREGYDIRRHALSLMSNGEWGWVHIAMMIATGLLTIAGAAGMWRAMSGAAAPVSIGIYGLGLVGAGFFTADPALGFPPGTPADAHSLSSHGLMHFACGGIGFLALVSACCLLARRYFARGERGWAVYSLATGVIFLGSFVCIATLSQGGPEMRAAVNIGFTVAVAGAWAWLTAVAARTRREADGQSGSSTSVTASQAGAA